MSSIPVIPCRDDREHPDPRHTVQLYRIRTIDWTEDPGFKIWVQAQGYAEGAKCYTRFATLKSRIGKGGGYERVDKESVDKRRSQWFTTPEKAVQAHYTDALKTVHELECQVERRKVDARKALALAQEWGVLRLGDLSPFEPLVDPVVRALQPGDLLVEGRGPIRRTLVIIHELAPDGPAPACRKLVFDDLSTITLEADSHYPGAFARSIDLENSDE
jgi:hypothetical protein